MNVFAVSSFPCEAAQMLCDQHVIKMILETAQICSTAMYVRDCWSADLYRPTHQRHPCVRWCALTTSNFRWLVSHGLELCAEYTRRYDKRHKTQGIMEHLDWIKLGPDYPIARLTAPPMCMPPHFKFACTGIPELAWDDVVGAYRRYYRYKMREMPKFTYTNAEIPSWLMYE
jgi:hypothetical protein